MSWDEELFAVLDDLEQQAEALYAAERDAELADRARAEYGAITLASRLMASVDEELTLGVLGVGRLAGTLLRVSKGWLLLSAGGSEWVVPLSAVASVGGASARSVPEVAWSPITRLGLGSALRRLSEAAEPCMVHLVDGSVHEARVSRVGADFAELSVAAGRVELVAFAALAAVRSRR
ncbi:hypothetical protein [Nocardioides sp.]|uniref:hypothetical protein n=1 Tax=Nocardioides sp. TaxID=35761 RepID=UPI002ED4F744